MAMKLGSVMCFGIVVFDKKRTKTSFVAKNLLFDYRVRSSFGPLSLVVGQGSRDCIAANVIDARRNYK